MYPRRGSFSELHACAALLPGPVGLVDDPCNVGAVVLARKLLGEPPA